MLHGCSCTWCPRPWWYISIMCKSWWPGLLLFGAVSAPGFPLQRAGKNARKPTRTLQIRLIPGLTLIITSASLLTDLAAFTQPHPSLSKGINYFFYSILSQDYRFLFDICLSSGSSKHSWTPALIYRFQIHLNKALFTEERGKTWRFAQHSCSSEHATA